MPYAFSENIIIPRWVVELNDFWKTEQISDIELINALQYLQNREIIKLVFVPEYDIMTNYHLSISLQNEFISTKFSNCSDGWYVTGYYTPKEEDFIGNHVNIDGMNLRSDFIDEIMIEGWGKSKSFGYVGWYDDLFHLNDFPQDANGDKLEFPTVAVDTSILKPGSNFLIPTLPYPWNEVIFHANDIGPSIKGKHIDVFTGEGNMAKKMTERITSYENKICLEN